MRTRIWNELTKTKHDVEYLRVYSLTQNAISRFMNVFILVFSTGGLLGWGIFKEPKYAAIACIITSAVSSIKLISPYFILSDKEVKKLDKYHQLLVEQYDMIEKFWYDNASNSADCSQFSNAFYKITAKTNEINSRYNDLTIISLFFLTKRAKLNSDNYFKQVFNV